MSKERNLNFPLKKQFPLIFYVCVKQIYVRARGIFFYLCFILEIYNFFISLYEEYYT
jgi:hypothetical protein